jgi:very-short-patch-repair endonuclease
MDKASRLFRFLKDFNQLKNPVVTDLAKQLWSLGLNSIPVIEEITSAFRTTISDASLILKVMRPVFDPCPAPPIGIIEWLEDGWFDIDNIEAKHLESRSTRISGPDHTEEYVIEKFEEDFERINVFDRWLEQRSAWITRQLPKIRGMEIYNDLFRLYSRVRNESESVEVVFGDGQLRYAAEERYFDHPVLLQPAVIRFNPDIPAFSFHREDEDASLYAPLLRVIPGINPGMLNPVFRDAEETSYDIVDINNAKAFYQRIVTAISTSGQYVEEFRNFGRHPEITSSPVLLLRKRTQGFTELIEGIVSEIEETGGESLPDFLKPVIGEDAVKYSEVDDDPLDDNGFDSEVLLTLPANAEQLRVVKFLDRYGAVLVQGPPGTGKTHTIANLIGHLLSEGKSVLVTSHTEKALSVLKEKVFKSLQSLCISMLSSTSYRKEMDSVLFDITQKSSEIDVRTARRKIDKSTIERVRLSEELSARHVELLNSRSSEYQDIVYTNTSLTPIEAAKFLRSGEATASYLPEDESSDQMSLDDTAGLGLSIQELVELYQTNSSVPIAVEEVLVRGGVPEMHFLVPEVLIDLRAKSESMRRIVETSTPSILHNVAILPDKLGHLCERASDCAAQLHIMDELSGKYVVTGARDKVYLALWRQLQGEHEQLLEQYEAHRRKILGTEIVIPNGLDSAEALLLIDDLCSSGFRNPFNKVALLTRPKTRALLDSCLANGRQIQKSDDLVALRSYLQYMADKASFVRKLNQLISEVDTSQVQSAHDIESSTRFFIRDVLRLLSWYEQLWMVLIIDIRKILGSEESMQEISSPATSNDFEKLKKASALLHDELLKKQQELLYLELRTQWDNLLATYKNLSSRGWPFAKLYQSAIEGDSYGYSDAYKDLLKIKGCEEAFTRRRELINRLSTFAPGWAREVSERRGMHGEGAPPSNIQDAWKWHQIRSQFKRIEASDPLAIQKLIQGLQDKLRENAKELAYWKAWSALLEHRTSKQTQAIEGWRQTQRLIGAGQGRNAPRYRQAARDLMPQCQSAIPVWIMPLSKVAESYSPKNNKFDVVIIDEASQADLLGLCALYLGRKVVIVGDDEQVSPNPVGIKSEETNALIEQYLIDIPNRHLFTERASIYDIAKSAGFQPLMLTEHFRSLPEIINFSNRLSYNGRIKPLRDSSGVKTAPPVIEYRVPAAVEVDKVNACEAEHIASLVLACAKDPRYYGKTFGVISMFGQEQAFAVDRLLQKHMEPKEYEDRKVQVGIPPSFQGDERDIVFISMVYSPNTDHGPLRRIAEEGNNDLNKKRYNVAASRARDQLWVVHSLNPERDLKPEDIRLRLIRHAIHPELPDFEDSLRTSESEFERLIMLDLLQNDYSTTSQWKVGAYRIDLVVKDGKNKVAIECDGEKWHSRDDLPNDMRRQAILERLGWRFIRIRGSAYFRNPERTMLAVREELTAMRIMPTNQANTAGVIEQENHQSESIESITRVAASIRESWHQAALDGRSRDSLGAQVSLFPEDLDVNRNRQPTLESPQPNRHEVFQTKRPRGRPRKNTASDTAIVRHSDSSDSPTKRASKRPAASLIVSQPSRRNNAEDSAAPNIAHRKKKAESRHVPKQKAKRRKASNKSPRRLQAEGPIDKPLFDFAGDKAE